MSALSFWKISFGKSFIFFFFFFLTIRNITLDFCNINFELVRKLDGIIANTLRDICHDPTRNSCSPKKTVSDVLLRKRVQTKHEQERERRTREFTYQLVHTLDHVRDNDQVR